MSSLLRLFVFLRCGERYDPKKCRASEMMSDDGAEPFLRFLEDAEIERGEAEDPLEAAFEDCRRYAHKVGVPVTLVLFNRTQEDPLEPIKIWNFNPPTYDFAIFRR